MSSLLPPKKDVALALLERASVFVHLDPRAESVMVPPWLKKQPQLVLQIGLNMAVKIPDLEVGEEAVCCTLSFSRRPHYCYVPWGAVYALVGEDGRGMVWPENIPPEVSSQAQLSPAKPTARPTLRPVPSDTAVAESRKPITTATSGLTPLDSPVPEAGGGSHASPRSPSERPYLRLVK
jgi:stringent starvation protein B